MQPSHVPEVLRRLRALLDPGELSSWRFGRWFAVASVVVAAALLLAALRRARAFAAVRRAIARGDREAYPPSPRANREIAGGLLLLYLLGSSWLLLVGWGRERGLANHLARLDLELALQCEGLVYLATAGGIALGVGTLAAALAVTCRARWREGLAALASGDPRAASAWSRHPGPALPAVAAAVVVLELFGVAPVGAAIVRYVELVSRWSFARSERPTAADLDAARHLLALALTVAGVAVVGAAALVVGATARAAAARQRFCPSVPASLGWSRRALTLVALAAAAGAAGLSWRSQPLRTEIETPLPQGYVFHGDLNCLCLPAPPFPEGEGPDPLVDATHVRVYSDRFTVDQYAAGTTAELHSILSRKRELWHQVQPQHPYPGQVILDLPRSTPMARVSEVLAALRAPSLGLREARLAFTHHLTVERPVMGTLQGERSSAIRLWLAPNPEATIVSPRSFGRVADWVEALREERQRGHEVAVDAGGRDAEE